MNRNHTNPASIVVVTQPSLRKTGDGYTGAGTTTDHSTGNSHEHHNNNSTMGSQWKTAQRQQHNQQQQHNRYQHQEVKGKYHEHPLHNNVNRDQKEHYQHHQHHEDPSSKFHHNPSTKHQHHEDPSSEQQQHIGSSEGPRRRSLGNVTTAGILNTHTNGVRRHSSEGSTTQHSMKRTLPGPGYAEL